MRDTDWKYLNCEHFLEKKITQNIFLKNKLYLYIYKKKLYDHIRKTNQIIYIKIDFMASLPVLRIYRV